MDVMSFEETMHAMVSDLRVLEQELRALTDALAADLAGVEEAAQRVGFWATQLANGLDGGDTETWQSHHGDSGFHIP